MKSVYALVPVLLSVLLVIAIDPVSNRRSSSNEACARAIRVRLTDSNTYSEVATEYKRGDETWSREEMMAEVAREADQLTLIEANHPHSDDDAAREKLAGDLKSEFATLLPSEGSHFDFAISKIDFDARDQSSAPIHHVAYCKFLVVDGTDLREPFSVVIK